MTRDELNRLDDHDLLVLLHERIKVHSEEHRRATITFRWTVGVVLTLLFILVTGATVVGQLGNP